MAKDYDDLFNAFNDLLADQDLLTSAYKVPSGGLNQYDANDALSETFMTSEEMEQAEQQAQGNDGTSSIPLAPVAPDVEEELHFKRYNKRRVHKYTEKELEEIRESCKKVLVYDYAEKDTYHLSDEEIYQIDSLREIRVQLSTLHKLYNRVDEWVKAMRIVMKAWKILEEKDNYLYTTEEFYQLIGEDRIYHNAIIMPRLKGMNTYNLAMLIQYISNPEMDPTDLLSEEQKRRQKMYSSSFYDDEDEEEEETEEEKMERLLDPEDVELLLKEDVNEGEPPMYLNVASVKDVQGYDQRTLSSKKLKKLPKRKRAKAYARHNLHVMLNKIQNDPSTRENRFGFGYGYSSLLTKSMFEPQKEENVWGDLKMQGSWASDSDTYAYELQMRDALLNQHIPGISYRTYGDDELDRFFNTMEAAGLNVLDLRRRMNMTVEEQNSRFVESTKKQSKKLEAAILQRITKLNGDPKFKKTIERAEKALAEDAY